MQLYLGPAQPPPVVAFRPASSMFFSFIVVLPTKPTTIFLEMIVTKGIIELYVKVVSMNFRSKRPTKVVAAVTESGRRPMHESDVISSVTNT